MLARPVWQEFKTFLFPDWSGKLNLSYSIKTGKKKVSFYDYTICVEFLSHHIIRLQLVKIGISFMLSFLDDFKATLLKLQSQ